jgi:dihydropteroate synthase
MRSKGTPDTMQSMTHYDDFLSDILQYFAKKIAILREKGFSKEIIIDPGYGFAKTVEQNYTLLRELSIFECFRAPLLVGISRKSMIYKPLNIEPSEALNGTTTLNAFALERGANILRVHDVKEAVETIKLYNLLGKQNNENHISTTRNRMGR